MKKHHEIVWWDYEYDCKNPECLHHGRYSLGNNVDFGKIRHCTECNKPILLQFIEKYRLETRIVTPAVIEYRHIPIDDQP